MPTKSLKNNLTQPQAERAWAGLAQKQRNSVAGAAMAQVLALADTSGHAPLGAVLGQFFPDLPAEKARHSFDTQFVNRPPLNEHGVAPLRLKRDRVAGKTDAERAQSAATAQVWFVSDSPTTPEPEALRPPADKHLALGFGNTLATQMVGKEILARTESLALQKAEQDIAAYGQSKAEINYGRVNEQHGMRSAVDPANFGHTKAVRRHSLDLGDGRASRILRSAISDNFDEQMDRRDLARDEFEGDDTKQKALSDAAETPEEKHPVALSAMLDWAKDNAPNAPRLLVLLGDYGTGKTSHGQQFSRVLNGAVAHDLWTGGPQQPKALFIDLAELAGVSNLSELSIEEMLVIVLKKRDGVAIQTVADVAPFVQDARAGRLVCVFDGLDELLKNDPQVLHNVFDQLVRTVEWPNDKTTTTTPKAIISCRSHYFRDVETQHSFFNTRSRGRARGPDYLCLTLLPWTSEQIDAFVHKRQPEEQAKKLLKVIADTYNLTELASRPVLLAMMSEHLQDLQALSGEGSPVTAAALYNLTVASWLERDNGKHRMAAKHKPLLMGALASALWSDGAEAWGADRLDAWLQRALPSLFGSTYGVDQLSAIEEDLRTATFIVRPNARQFNFAHRSFGEYFLARFCLDALDHTLFGHWAESPNALDLLHAALPTRLLNDEALLFLKELWLADKARRPAREMALRAPLLFLLLRHSGQAQALANSPDAPLPPAPALHGVLWQIVNHLGLANSPATRDEKLQTKFLPTLSKAGDTLNLRGLNFAEQLWQDQQLHSLPPLDLRGTHLRGLHARRCKWGQVLCDAQTIWNQAVLRDCDTQGLQWGQSMRAGLVVRSGKLPTFTAPLDGPWHLPRAIDSLSGLVYLPACGGRGERLAASSDDGTVRVYSVVTGAELLVLEALNEGVTSVAHLPPQGLQSERLAITGRDGTARVYDLAIGTELLVLKGHKGPITSAAYLPAYGAQGERLATTGHDGTARVYSLATGAKQMVLNDHKGFVTSATYLPSNGNDEISGERLATTGSDGTARVYSLATGLNLMVLRGHNDWVTSTAYLPACGTQGERLATTGSDGTARVYSLDSGAELLVLKGRHGDVSSAAYLPPNGKEDEPGERLATCGSDGTVRVYSLVTGAELLLLKGNHEDLTSVAYLPAQGLQIDRLATSRRDGTARVHSLSTGAELLVLKSDKSVVTSAAYMPAHGAQGERLATTASDGTARVYSLVTGAGLMVLKCHNDWVSSATYLPAHGAQVERLATAGDDGTARVYDLATGAELMVLKGHNEWVTSATYIPPHGTRDELLATVGRDGTARVCSLATGRALMILKVRIESIIGATYLPAVSMHDGRIATIAYDGTARVYNLTTGSKPVVLKAHKDWVVSATYLPASGAHDDRLVTTGESGITHIHSLTTSIELLALKGHNGVTCSVTYVTANGPHHEHIANAGEDGAIYIYSLATGSQLLMLEGHNDQVTSVTHLSAHAEYGERLVTTGHDGTARIWHLTTETSPNGEPILSWSHCRVMVPHPTGHFEPSWADFDPQGRLLACSDSAVDDWLYRIRDGQMEPIEAAL